MRFVIRESRREDLDELWRIDQACFPPEISYSRLELSVYMRRSGSFTLVAEPASGMGDQPLPKSGIGPARILGFIVAEASRRGLGHVITIDVLETARRCGLGSELLRSAENRLRSAGCDNVVLETAVDNLAALAFYKRHHYFLMKTVPRYYSNGVDAFLLKKDLRLSAVPANVQA